MSISTFFLGFIQSRKLWSLAIAAIWVLMGAISSGAEERCAEDIETMAQKKPSIELTADKVEFDRERDTYIANGSVIVVRESSRLTADHVIFKKLIGELVATGHVHLHERTSDIWSERLILNVNTEIGVIVKGTFFVKEKNSLIEGRKVRRLSETHYRAQHGSFTNCNAQDGEVPAWRFTFEDVDFDLDGSLYGKNVWLNINDHPIIPLPALWYPLGATRKTGFLIPSAGVDNVFGFRFQQGFFWAINASQDLTVSPLILSNVGPGGDLEYRYILNRKSRGQWLVNSLFDTGGDRSGALIKGSHHQEVTPDLSVRMNVNLATKRRFLSDFSNSGVQRALPSQQSILNINQRLPYGRLYLTGQFLQPLGIGGNNTFQRLPEIGHRFANYPIFGTPFRVGMDSTFVHFFRQTGFNVSRVDLLPSLTMDDLHIGHVLGLRPQVKLRETIYNRGKNSGGMENRGTFWVGMEAFSNLSKGFQLGKSSRLQHTIEPRVIYEFVPQSDQFNLVQIDAVDNLPKKSLLTYSLSNKLIEQNEQGTSNTWLDLFLAQSYHVGSNPVRAKTFSDIWGKATINKPAYLFSPLSQFSVSVDSFFDPNKSEFSQFNSDLRLGTHKKWYLNVGQRFARNGTRVRRGDIWNPLSFNEVLAPQKKILFFTAGGGVRLPYGLTLGSRWFHDLQTGKSSEVDIVGMYQNPCRCFSVGVSWVRFPDRQQFNVLFSLTGLFANQGIGAQVMQSILGPLMAGERGIPWRSR